MSSNGKIEFQLIYVDAVSCVCVNANNTNATTWLVETREADTGTGLRPRTLADASAPHDLCGNDWSICELLELSLGKALMLQAFGDTRGRIVATSRSNVATDFSWQHLPIYLPR